MTFGRWWRERSSGAPWLRISLALFLATASPSGQDAPPQTFRGGTNIVLVDAYPKRNGRIVEGLTAADFEVREDGRPQKIATVEFIRGTGGVPETTRRDPSGLREMYAEAANPHNQVFVAYLDTLHSGVESGVLARRPLVDLLDRLIGPQDLFGVMTPNLRATDLTLGRRTQSVEDVLARHWTWGQAQRTAPDQNDSIEQDIFQCFHKKVAGYPNGEIRIEDWVVDDGPVRRLMDEILLERRRADRTFTSLENLITHLGTIRDTRSVLLTLSNGWVLARRWESLAAEPFKDPADVRWSKLRGPKGAPTPDDELVRQPPPVGRGGVSVGANPDREIQGCQRELERLAKLDLQQRFRDVELLAVRNNVSFYPIAVGGLAATADGAAQRIGSRGAVEGQSLLGRDLARMSGRVQSLREIAEVTGGTAVVNTNDLAAGFRSLADDFSGFYLISYSPTNAARDGRYRRLEVKMKDAGIAVRARAGYVANEVLVAMGAAGGARPPDPATVAVETALGDLGRARTTSEVTSVAMVDGLMLTTVVELGQTFQANGWGAGARVDVDVFGADGARVGTETGRIAEGTRGTVIRVPLGFSSGPWRVTTRVTGARTIQDTVTAIARSAKILGEPLVYRATPSPRSPAYPVADLLFSRTERVRVVWPVLDRPDSTSVRLLDRQGKALGGPLAAVPGTESDRAVLAVDLVLGPLSDGDYVVELTARRGANSERRLQAFRVVR